MTRPAIILFLGANPSDTTRLALGREVCEIDRRLRASDHRDAFRMEQAWAVSAADLQACLLRYRPTIVHFSGHGSPAGELLLEDERSTAMPVTVIALAHLFSVMGRQVRCVLLNACYSEAQARAIAEHVDCVVGMTTAIGDEPAIAFAGAFYQALGYGENIETAFDLGCNQVNLTGLPGADVPRLLVRAGVRAGEIHLAEVDSSALLRGSPERGATLTSLSETQPAPERRLSGTPALLATERANGPGCASPRRLGVIQTVLVTTTIVVACVVAYLIAYYVLPIPLNAAPVESRSGAGEREERRDLSLVELPGGDVRSAGEDPRMPSPHILGPTDVKAPTLGVFAWEEWRDPSEPEPPEGDLRVVAADLTTASKRVVTLTLVNRGQVTRVLTHLRVEAKYKPFQCPAAIPAPPDFVIPVVAHYTIRVNLAAAMSQVDVKPLRQFPPNKPATIKIALKPGKTSGCSRGTIRLSTLSDDGRASSTEWFDLPTRLLMPQKSTNYPRKREQRRSIGR